MDSTQTQKPAVRQAAAATAVPQHLGGFLGNSPRVQQLQALSASLNASPSAAQLAAQGSMVGGSGAGTEGQAGNRTGLPDELKAGVEQLSGLSMDSVRVHYNSPQPAQMQAHAYTQGTDIHVAPSQERHLPHEAWHVVQQQQGRVRPTRQLRGFPLNDSAALEDEADRMGRRAVQRMPSAAAPTLAAPSTGNSDVMQRILIEGTEGDITVGQAVDVIRNHLDMFGYRFHDYIMDDEFIYGIVDEIDRWGVHYAGWEAFFDMVKDDIERHVSHSQDGLEIEEAPVTVEVENVGNRFNGSLDEGELARQVAGQVAGLNQMTAAD